MLYEVITLTGKSGDYSTVFMLVPVESQTVIFRFIPCTDDNGNNYSVVKIGDQWWMAENLNSGTYAEIVITSYSIHYTKLYDVIVDVCL